MGVVNICFHGIGTPGRRLDPGEARYWISEGFFLETLDVLARRDDVAISFDDGNASDVEIGLPALRERGLRAQFFVLAGRIGRPGSVTSADIVELRRRGMTIGSHGMDHVPWVSLPPATLRRELVDARDLIARASGAPVHDAALPKGRYDRRVLRALKDAGYAHVYSSDRRRATQGAWLQPRYSVRSDDTLEAIASMLEPTWRVAARSKAVGVLKRIR